MICKKCNIDSENFSKSSFLRGVCRSCIKIQSDEYYIKNNENIKRNKKEYYNLNKHEILDKNKLYYIENKEQLLIDNKNYRIENAKEINIQRYKYRKNNKEKISEKQYLYEKNRLINDFEYRLHKNISSIIRRAMKKGDSTLNILSYSMSDLIIHLELKFEWWMTWSNYGMYFVDSWVDDDHTTWRWNIDHIVPRSYLKYNSINDENFKKCWSLDNLRPYSAKMNLLDGNRIYKNI